jgi:hypothetical protein
MVMASPTSDQGSPAADLPITLEIFQGRGSQQFPVTIKSLSARGVTLAATEVPGNLKVENCSSGEAIIRLPEGDIREIRGNLIWARPQVGDDPEAIFGLELSSSNVKVRRALEEQLQAFPADLKNMWDHWDAVHDEYEAFGANQPAAQTAKPSSRTATPAPPQEPRQKGPPGKTSTSDKAYYLVGFGGVAAGLCVYYLAPETYRLLGIILAAYGGLTIVGKSVWSLMQKRPRSQGKITAG